MNFVDNKNSTRPQISKDNGVAAAGSPSDRMLVVHKVRKSEAEASAPGSAARAAAGTQVLVGEPDETGDRLDQEAERPGSW